MFKKVENRAVLDYTFVIGSYGDINLIRDGTKIGKCIIEKIVIVMFLIDEGLEVRIGGLKPVAPD